MIVEDSEALSSQIKHSWVLITQILTFSSHDFFRCLLEIRSLAPCFLSLHWAHQSDWTLQAQVERADIVLDQLKEKERQREM